MGTNSKALAQLAKIAANQQKMIDKLAQNKPIARPSTDQTLAEMTEELKKARPFKPTPIIDSPYKPATPKRPGLGNTVLPSQPLSKKVIDEPAITTRPDVSLTKKQQEQAIEALLQQNEQERGHIESSKFNQVRQFALAQLENNRLNAQQFLHEMKLKESPMLPAPYDQIPLFGNLNEQHKMAIQRYLGKYDDKIPYNDQYALALNRAQQEIEALKNGQDPIELARNRAYKEQSRRSLTAEQFLKYVLTPISAKLPPPYSDHFLFAQNNIGFRKQQALGIFRYTRRPPGPELGVSLEAAKARALAEIKPTTIKSREEQRKELEAKPRMTPPGAPVQNQRTAGELKQAYISLSEDIEKIDSAMTKAERKNNEEFLAKLTLDRAVLQEKLEAVTLDIKSLLSTKQELVVPEEDANNRKFVEIEIIDGNGLIEKRMVPASALKELQAKTVTKRNGTKTHIVEVEDMDNLPPELQELVDTTPIPKQGTAMNDKEVIAKLIKIAHTQQQIIAKLAQNQDPNQVTLDVGPQRAAPAVNPDPPPTSLSVAKPTSIRAAIMSKLTDANKDQIPMPMGLEVDGNTLYWFTRNKMQPTAMIALHKDIVKAIKTIQKEFGNRFPESKYITSCQYRPFRTAPMIVGQ